MEPWLRVLIIVLIFWWLVLPLQGCNSSETNIPHIPPAHCQDFDALRELPVCTVCWGPVPVDENGFPTGNRETTFNSCNKCQWNELGRPC